MMEGQKTAFGRKFVIAIPYVWLLFFFLLPFLVVLKISIAEYAIAVPPYTPLFVWSEDAWLPDIQYTFDNYAFIFSDSLYIGSYLSSLKIASVSTIIILFIGYAIAYAIVKAPKRWRWLLLMLIILPFWTSFLIRVYAWIGILKPEGLLNLMLMNIGIIDQPLMILNTKIAVYIGIVYSYLPFMILPLYANLEKLDGNLLEAANDLGCGPLKAFFTITIPLTMPGIIAGCFITFIPAVGEFVIPDLLGGADTLMFGNVLWKEFFNNRDWPIASAITIILLLSLIVPILLYQRAQQRALK